MSVKCGNPKHGKPIYHESASEVRACFADNLTADGIINPVENHFQAAISSEWDYSPRTVQPVVDQETWPWTQPVIERREYSSSDRKPFTMGYAAAEALADRRPAADLENGPGWTGPSFIEPEPTPPAAKNDPLSDRATTRQMAFLSHLVAERDLEGLPSDWSQKVADDRVSFAEAREMITALKLRPRKALAANAHKPQPWRELSAKVPAGYYGTTDEAGKNHFYRVSVGRNDFYKVQEQASEELHFVPLNRYEGILRAILETGLEAAGLKYATERSRCYRCNRELTDNIGNPYFAQGLGPECGAK
jgi:hypothetical protein